MLKGIGMTQEQFYYNEIQEWLASGKRKIMIDSERYLDGDHDILKYERTMIGEDGTEETIKNVPNNHVVDNQYGRMVTQKTDYLFSQRFSIKTEDDTYSDILNTYFDDEFWLKMQRIGSEAVLGGVDFIYVYYDEDGKLQIDVFYPFECIPYWKDNMHTKMDTFVRVFNVEAWEGTEKKDIQKAEVFTENGIQRFTISESCVLPDMDDSISSYISVKDEEKEDTTNYNWEKFPVIAFKYNDRELPLLKRIKSLQDGINKMESAFENNMDEDPRNCIIVLKNYDGEDLGEFRHNLAQYGAVKVETTDGVAGDVQTLTVDVTSENYQMILKIFKQALIENARGYDSKDDRVSSGSPNEMNIKSMYSDLDLDANSMETQFKASLKKLLWFIDQDIKNRKLGDYSDVPVEFNFNRNMMVVESEQITNCRNSQGVVSNKTLLAHHPFVTDVQAELDQIDEEKQKSMDDYGLNQNKNKTPVPDPDDDPAKDPEGDPDGGND